MDTFAIAVLICRTMRRLRAHRNAPRALTQGHSHMCGLVALAVPIPVRILGSHKIRIPPSSFSTGRCRGWLSRLLLVLLEGHPGRVPVDDPSCVWFAPRHTLFRRSSCLGSDYRRPWSSSVVVRKTNGPSRAFREPANYQGINACWTYAQGLSCPGFMPFVARWNFLDPLGFLCE